MSYQYNDGPQYAGQPYSGQPHPGQPYAGQPYAGQSQQYGPPLPMPPAHRRRRSGKKLALKLVLTGVSAIIAFLVVSALLTDDTAPKSAAPGDCVAREGTSSIKVVKCGSADSAYKVVGKVPGKTHAQFSVSSSRICSVFKGAKSAYWQGEVGGTGYILCLAPAG
jgi:hypothetical protein